MADGSGTLWLVATPIGTLGDISPRACEVLAEVEVILAEDTRRTRALLGHLGIPAGRRLRSLHEHNEAAAVPRVLAELEAGSDVALVSDAGTPVLSDPGFVLVREARRTGATVRSVPGPSSFTAALAASGQPPLPATLVGFLPPRGGPRRRRVAELGAAPGTLVVFLSPHRLAAELRDLADGLGADRPATLLAELSKLHERAETASLGELAERFEGAVSRGEHVVVVGPPLENRPDGSVDADGVRRAYERELAAAGGDRREALRATARACGLRRRDVFALLVERDAGEAGP
jgi:16S rRNA (cytidine1402-2'-O)-methyltransferase